MADYTVQSSGRITFDDWVTPSATKGYGALGVYWEVRKYRTEEKFFWQIQGWNSRSNTTYNSYLIYEDSKKDKYFYFYKDSIKEENIIYGIPSLTKVGSLGSPYLDKNNKTPEWKNLEPGTASSNETIKQPTSGEFVINKNNYKFYLVIYNARFAFNASGGFTSLSEIAPASESPKVYETTLKVSNKYDNNSLDDKDIKNYKTEAEEIIDLNNDLEDLKAKVQDIMLKRQNPIGSQNITMIDQKYQIYYEKSEDFNVPDSQDENTIFGPILSILGEESFKQAFNIKDDEDDEDNDIKKTNFFKELVENKDSPKDIITLGNGETKNKAIEIVNMLYNQEKGTGNDLIAYNENLDTSVQTAYEYACHGACAGLCRGTCYGECQGCTGKETSRNIKNSKGALGCKAQNSTITTACGGNCSAGCVYSCSASCGTTCSQTTGPGSGGSCNNCSSTCAGNCGNNCKGTCNGCSGICRGGCLSSCSGACYTGCSTGCGTGCKDKCENSCKDNCSEGCQKGCGSSCSNNCQFVEK